MVDGLFTTAASNAAMASSLWLSSVIVTITVADNGRWKAPTGEDPFRGRGLPLMELLSDHNTVTRAPTGTEVTMTWHDPVTDPA